MKLFKPDSIKVFIFFIAFSLMIYSLPAALKVLKANKDYAKLSPQVTLMGQITIGDGGMTLREAVANKFLPRFIFSPDSRSGWFLSTSKRLITFDTEALKAALAIPVREISQILYQFPGTEDSLIIHWDDDSWHLSRCHFPSGKITWSIESDFVTRFKRIVMKTFTNYTTTTIYYYPFLIRFTYLPGKNHLFFTGLIVRGSAKFRLFSSASMIDWGIRNLMLDAATGEIFQDTEFDLQRDISNSVKLFVSLTRREFQVVDLSDASVKMTGKFGVKDILAKKDFAPPIDMRKRVEWAWRSDVHPVLTRNELILCSHWEKRKAFKVVRSNGIWLKYDLKGNFKQKIDPAPVTFIERAIRNQKANSWPMIFRKYRSGNGLVLFHQDGTLSNAPLPVIKGYPYDYFHDEKYLYKLVKNVLHRTRIGENTAEPIYTAPRGKRYKSAPFGGDGLVVLSGSKSTILVRLSDGKEIDLKEALESSSPELFWSVTDIPRLRGKLPKMGLPAKFRYYKDFRAITCKQSTVELYKKSNIRTLRLWGKTKFKDRGDIVLVPGLIKKGGAVLIGIGLPENRVLFSLPMGRIKGLSSKLFPDNPGLIYSVKIVDQQNALLVVADDLSTYSVYKITRPTM